MKFKIKTAAGLLAALMLPAVAQAQYVGPTNLTVYNFDTDQVTGRWGNWFGGDFGGVVWDNTIDGSNNPSSGSLKLTLNVVPNQYVLWDSATPPYSGLPLVGGTSFTNLSFDLRYDASSAIRTNGNGSLDFGLIRIGSRTSAFDRSWYVYVAIPATNGVGAPNTDWVHLSINMAGNAGDLAASGILDTIIAADNLNYNPTLVGQQIIWVDNIKYSGYVAPVPPPKMTIEKATPALRLFGGSGQYGRAQLEVVGDSESWYTGVYPVSYSMTILDNATSPGGLDHHIHLITGTDGYSGADYTQPNVLWLQIISGTGTNKTSIANLSWKTNAPNTNPDTTASGQVALRITNSVLAGTWTLTFNSATTGTLTAPGASPAPFTLGLTESDVINYFSNPLEARFGIQNYGNIANGGVPHDWARISVSGTLGLQINEDFTKKGTNQLDLSIWDLGHSDGVSVVNVVPTNSPYWVKWTLPDNGFSLVSSNSLVSGVTNWNTPANVTPIAQGAFRWALIPSASLPAGNQGYFALIKRTFNKMQVLLPGETNAPGTVTGKVGTPNPVDSAVGTVNVTINAVDATYHIATSATGDVIALGNTDTTAVPPAPAALVNGTVTQVMPFGSLGTFTITATNTSNLSMPTATSAPVTVQ